MLPGLTAGTRRPAAPSRTVRRSLRSSVCRITRSSRRWPSDGRTFQLRKAEALPLHPPSLTSCTMGSTASTEWPSQSVSSAPTAPRWTRFSSTTKRSRAPTYATPRTMRSAVGTSTTRLPGMASTPQRPLSSSAPASAAWMETLASVLQSSALKTSRKAPPK